MAVTSSYKICPKCKTANIDKDVCESCGEILSYKKKQELKEQKILKEEVAILKYQEENPNFIERMKKHPFFLFKIIGYILHSVVVVVSAIGAGLAWATAMAMGG